MKDLHTKSHVQHKSIKFSIHFRIKNFELDSIRFGLIFKSLSRVQARQVWIWIFAVSDGTWFHQIEGVVGGNELFPLQERFLGQWFLFALERYSAKTLCWPSSHLSQVAPDKASNAALRSDFACPRLLFDARRRRSAQDRGPVPLACSKCSVQRAGQRFVSYLPEVSQGGLGDRRGTAPIGISKEQHAASNDSSIDAHDPWAFRTLLIVQIGHDVIRYELMTKSI